MKLEQILTQNGFALVKDFKSPLPKNSWHYIVNGVVIIDSMRRKWITIVDCTNKLLDPESIGLTGYKHHYSHLTD